MYVHLLMENIVKGQDTEPEGRCDVEHSRFEYVCKLIRMASS
jgi:hypothetical protein